MSVSSHRLLAVGARSGVVARLVIPDNLEGCEYAQLRTRQHDRQQHQELGHGQCWGFFFNFVCVMW